jgi:hypothetical protein
VPIVSKLQSVAAKVAIVVAVTVIIGGVFYAPLIYRESDGKPFTFMWAVTKLEVTGADVVAVVPDSRILMHKCCSEPLSKPLSNFMAARGWTYKDQMGAGIIYEKGNTRLLAVSRTFSRRYVAYQLDRRP